MLPWRNGPQTRKKFNQGVNGKDQWISGVSAGRSCNILYKMQSIFPNARFEQKV